MEFTVNQLLSYVFQKLHLLIYASNSWHDKSFYFNLSFWILKVWKGREKIQKIEYLKNKKSFSDKILDKAGLKACIRSFCQIFIFFSPNDSPLKTTKKNFILSQKLFSFLRYSNFYFFPSFPHVPGSKGQMEVE